MDKKIKTYENEDWIKSVYHCPLCGGDNTYFMNGRAGELLHDYYLGRVEICLDCEGGYFINEFGSENKIIQNRAKYIKEKVNNDR